MTLLVIDASAAVLLASMRQVPAGLAAFDCVAPPLMWSESLSALLEAAHRGELPAVHLTDAVDRLEALPITVHQSDAASRRRALGIARALGWAKSYDAEYVALAQALRCPLLTADARLIRGAGHLVEMVEPAQV